MKKQRIPRKLKKKHKKEYSVVFKDGLLSTKNPYLISFLQDHPMNSK